MLKKIKNYFSINKNNAPFYFLAPAVILFSIFTIYPILRTLYLSFYTKIAGENVFYGINNYINLFSDETFFIALKNTFILLIFQVPIMTSLSLIIAVGLNSTLVKFKTLFRISYFSPAVTDLVAYAIVFSLLLNTDYGFVNYILSFFGFDKISWLTTPFWARISLMIVMTWRWTGYNMIIMLSGLQGISNDLYEAAEIDGAGSLKKFFHITLPLMRPIILFSLILSTIGTLKLFNEPYILTSGGPNNSTLTLALYLYRTGFRYFDFGYASAISYVLVILSAIFSYFQLKIGGEESGGM